MVSLSSVGSRWENTLYRLDGVPFKGRIMVSDEGQVPTYDFSSPRNLIHVRVDCVLRSGDIFSDPAGRMFVTADHDVGVAGNRILHRTHRLFPVTHILDWYRETGTIDPLTQMEKSSGVPEYLGKVYVLMEPIQREFTDSALRVGEEKKRILTNVKLEYNDVINNMRVKRIDDVLSITYAELQ